MTSEVSGDRVTTDREAEVPRNKMEGNMQMPPYDSQKCSWQVYMQVFKNKIQIANIEESKWQQHLLANVGFEVVTLITELCFPDKPEDKEFSVLNDLIEKHLAPKPSEMAETYKFMQRNQQEQEGVREYVTALKKLSQTCNFSNYLERALRDKFVSGLRNEAIVKKLFGESKITFQQAVDIAVNMELADKEARLVVGTETREVQKVVKPAIKTAAKAIIKCTCCGKQGHIKPVCTYRNEECYKCHKRGHLAIVCRAKPTGFKKQKRPIVNQNVKRNVCDIEEVEYTVLKVVSEGEKAKGEEETMAEYGLQKLFEDMTQVEEMELNNKDKMKIVDKAVEVDLPQVNQVKEVTEIKEEKPSPWITTLSVEGINVQFEIDCGSDVTLIPVSLSKNLLPLLKIEPCNLKLKAYGGNTISVLGKARVRVKTKEKIFLAPLIVVKEGYKALIGRDWLNAMKINWPLVNKVSYSVNLLSSEETSIKLKFILQKYCEVFSGSPGEIKGPPGKLKLKANAIPKAFKARRIPYALENIVKMEIDKLVKEGKLYKVSREEDVPWATPIVPIVKGFNNVRICGDYKVTINPYLNVPQHPIPVIQDIFAKLNSNEKKTKCVFSKVDLRKAYMNRRMDEEAQKLMTLVTPWGLYRPTFMMFGMSPAPLDWQELMDQHFNIANVYCYLDDILIASGDIDDHLKTLDLVFNKLKTLNIKVNKEKTILVSPKLEYCGHILDKNGINKTPEHIKAILEAPQPRNIKELKSFLGTVNFYHKFLKNAAENLQPLYKLLKKFVKWSWNIEQKKAFEWAKTMIASDQVLIHYNPKLPLILSCDASKYGLGACLAHEVKIGNKVLERPIAFASRMLTQTESRYSQIDKEALSIIWAVKKFDLYLKGRSFTLVTDHKPLISIFNPSKAVSSIYADRMARWALILCNYQYSIKYRTSQHNTTADFPSRLPLPIGEGEIVDADFDQVVHTVMLESCPVTQTEVAKATQQDRILSKVFMYIQEGWPKKLEPEFLTYKGRESELHTVKGCVIWRGRIVIPESLRRKLLTELHAGHLGSFKMKALAKNYFWWPNIGLDVEAITQNCNGCIQVRNKPAIKPLHNWEWSSEPWQRIHADFAGPFMGFMWLIVIDSHSKWPEVVRMYKTTSTATINALRSMFARFGLPEHLVTDNGPQWTSNEFALFCKNNNIRHIFTAPYHPASNGLAERGVQSFKKAMLSCKFGEDNLDKSLQSWLLAYRTAPHATTSKAPCELMFGRSLRTRLSLIRKEVIIPKQVISSKMPKQFMPGDKVHVALYDGSQKWVDGTVLQPVGNVMYDVNTSKGTITRNVTQCLPRKSGDDTPSGATAEHRSKSPVKMPESSVGSPEHSSQDVCSNKSGVDPPTLVLRRSARTPKPRQMLDL